MTMQSAERWQAGPIPAGGRRRFRPPRAAPCSPRSPGIALPDPGGGFRDRTPDPNSAPRPAFRVNGTMAGRAASAALHKRCRHFIVWLYLHDVALAEVDDDVFSRFLAHDCTCAHPHFFIRTGLFAGCNNSRSKIGLFIEHLIGTGIAPPRPTPACEEPGRHVARFLVWLRRYRGIGERTIQSYHTAMRVLLPHLGDDPDRYSATLIRNTVQHRLETASRELAGRRASGPRRCRRLRTGG